MKRHVKTLDDLVKLCPQSNAWPEIVTLVGADVAKTSGSYRTGTRHSADCGSESILGVYLGNGLSSRTEPVFLRREHRGQDGEQTKGYRGASSLGWKLMDDGAQNFTNIEEAKF